MEEISLRITEFILIIQRNSRAKISEPEVSLQSEHKSKTSGCLWENSSPGLIWFLWTLSARTLCVAVICLVNE